MQNRLSGHTVSEGHFQKESGLDENRVRRKPPTCRISIAPWKEDFGSWMRQSPQICCAFHCHASTRSETGSRSVVNSCDIMGPVGLRLTFLHSAAVASRQALDKSPKSLLWPTTVERNRSIHDKEVQD